MVDSPIEAWLAEQTAAGRFPGATYAIGGGDRPRARGAVSRAALEPTPEPATLDTIYDLASLTKLFVTAYLAALLVDRKELDWSQPLAAFFPALKTWDRAEMTVAQCLSHTTGLPAWEPCYAYGSTPEAYVDRIAALPLAHRPGEGVRYSCLGALLLGFVLERVTTLSLDRAFAELVAAPLALRRTRFRPSAEWRARIAPTETGNQYERQMVATSYPEAGGYTGFRPGLIRGQVHDQNAFALGGVAGNAGLFGPVEEVWRLARELTPSGQGLFREETRHRFFRNTTGAMEEARSIGGRLNRGPTSGGPALGPAAMGQTGFTGTSCWIDPDRGEAFVLLTNRVHPRWSDQDMDRIRRAFHATGREAAA